MKLGFTSAPQGKRLGGSLPVNWLILSSGFHTWESPGTTRNSEGKSCQAKRGEVELQCAWFNNTTLSHSHTLGSRGGPIEKRVTAASNWSTPLPPPPKEDIKYEKNREMVTQLGAE